MSRSRRHTAGKPPSQRQLRVGELVRRAVDAVLRRGEVREPDLERVTITVPEVRMSPDLKMANVYVIPLGGGQSEAVTALLNANRKFIRSRIAKSLSLKFLPELRFFSDTTFEEANRIEALLRTEKVRQDIEPSGENT